MGIAHADVDAGGVASVVGEMDRRGYGRIEGFLGAADLDRMRGFVRRAVEGAGGEYVGFTGPEAVAGSSLDDLAASGRFRDLCRRVYEAGMGAQGPEVEFHQVLRCLSGGSAASHSMNFHYDSYVVTALLPIEIPTEGAKGDLLMWPNTRRVRRSYAANLVDKVLLDNPVTQAGLRALASRDRLTRITMVPGDLYLFWGYRSIHANEACDPDKVRATALFHYANPHAGSRVRSRLGRPTQARATA